MMSVSRGLPVKDPSDNVAILKHNVDGPKSDGSYHWSYETDKGSKASESGSLRELEDMTNAIQAQGSFSYTAPDGTVVTLVYIADENGFHPQGEHLPVAPAIPNSVKKALDWIAAHPEENDVDKPKKKPGNEELKEEKKEQLEEKKEQKEEKEELKVEK
jgi:hypothetical protein